MWTITGTVANVNTALANAAFTPALDFNGAATITTHVQDAAVTGPADGLITVNVTAVNDPPHISLNGAVQQTDPSGAVIFNAANSNLISVSDVDAGTGHVKVTLTATHGTMTLNGVDGSDLRSRSGDGTADATMTFTGTLADINQALNGMSFQSDCRVPGTG